MEVLKCKATLHFIKEGGGEGRLVMQSHLVMYKSKTPFLAMWDIRQVSF